jgi:hypothetical protein
MEAIMAKHPQNGPTFSKAGLKKRQSTAAPSLARKQAQLEQDARDCAAAREFNKDPTAWARKNMHLLKP